MSLPTVTVGTKFYISATLPMSETASAFQNVPYTQVKGVAVIGEIAKTYRTKTGEFIDSDFYKSTRIGYSYSPVELEMITLAGEAGQALLKTLLTKEAFSVKIEKPNGDVQFFTANLSLYSVGRSDVSSMCTTKYQLELQSELIEI